MLPEYPKFEPLEIQDRGLIFKRLQETERTICELSLGNLFIWTDFDRPQLTVINQNICILINPPNEGPYFLEPFGRRKIAETIDACLKHYGRVSRVSEEFAALLPAEKYELTPLRNQFDYIYVRQELAELKGRKFDGKRNHIKRFQRSFPDYSFTPLNESLRKESLRLFEKWFAIRKESKFFPRLAHTAQRNAIRRAFDNFKELNLMGAALIANHDLKGFTIGSFLSPEIASVHFLYGDPEAPGISQTLNWEACNKTYAKFKYVDLEQDLGIPGLRTAKLSYHPFKLEKKLEIKALTVL